MSWTANDAKSHTRKADTPAKRKQWATVANDFLNRDCDCNDAVKIANASVTDRFWKGNQFLTDRFDQYLDKVWSITKDADGDCPDCGGGGQQDGKDCPTCNGSGKATTEDDDDDMEDAALHTRKLDGRPKTSIRMYDRIELDDAAKVRELGNGYLSAMPRIARTGIQVYSGDECGIDFMDTIRVYRPESEVFHNDAVHTYTHLPLTLDHPTVQVNSSNWKKYAVGDTGDEVLRDGTAVRVPMMLRDAKAIKAFRAGTKQLSVGYDCDLEWTGGVTEDGQKYDAIQRSIRANHLAVVEAARGGSTLTIGDHKEGEYEGEFGETLFETYDRGEHVMNLRTILIDGLEVQVLDTAATVIQRAMSNLETRYQTLHDEFQKAKKKGDDDDDDSAKKDAAIKAKDAIIVTKDKEIETKIGEITVLKTQLDEAKKESAPAAIDAKARERAGVIDKANTIMGSRLKTDGMTVADIRKAVVESKVGNCKDWSDDRVEGAFHMLQTNAFQHDSGQRFPGGQGIEDAVRVFSGRPGAGYQSPQEARDKAYNDYDASVGEAWRGKQSA